MFFLNISCSVGKNPTANVLPSSDQGDTFTQEELSRFARRYENGYDISDQRYLKWLKLVHPNDQHSNYTIQCKYRDYIIIIIHCFGDLTHPL